MALLAPTRAGTTRLLEGHDIGNDRRPLATGIAATLCISGLAVGQPALALLGLFVLSAVPVRRLLGWDLALVLGPLALVLGATAIGVSAWLVGVDLVHPASPWLLVLTAASGAGLSTRRAPARGPDTQSMPWWGWVPAWTCLSIAAVQASQDAVLGWALDGTDLVQHALDLDAVRADGWLSYAHEGYPRGFHMLGAAVTARGGDITVEADIAFLAGSVLLALAVLALAVAAVTWRLAVAWVSPRGSAATAAGAAGLIVLTNPLQNAFVYMGAVPSLLAAAALVVLPVALARLDVGAPGRLLLAAGAAAVLAHLWQPLALAPAAAGVPVALALVRRRLHGFPSRRSHLLTVLCTVAAACLAIVAVVGIAADGGLSTAAIPGVLAAPPLTVVALGVAGLVVSARRTRAVAWPAAGIVLGLGVVVVVLTAAAGNGLDLTQWYPRKAIWFVVPVLTPFAALATSVVTQRVYTFVRHRVDRLGRSAEVTRFGLSASLLALAFCFVLPQAVAVPWASLGTVRGAWDARAGDAARAQLALAEEHGRRYQPAVTVPVAVGRSVLFDRHASYVVSKLIVRETGQAQTFGHPHQVCDDVASASAGGDAVVITKLDPLLLAPIMESGGCEHVRVIRVPGKIADTAVLLQRG